MKLIDYSATFAEDPDCCSDSESLNVLELETADGGGGAYLVIKTDRWAIDGEAGVDEFASRLKKFLRGELK